MKKLMMAVAIVCAAVGAQAAQISWGNTSTSLIYGLDGSTRMTTALATTYALSVELVDSNGNTVASTSSFNAMVPGNLAGTSYTYTYGTDYSSGSTFSIIAKMTVDGQAYEMKIGDFTITSAADNTGKDTFTWNAGTYGGLADTGTAGSGASWAAVPEPTSGLLLALGICGLALKRKRA